MAVFWRPFRVSIVTLSLWHAGVILLVLFGLPEPSVALSATCCGAFGSSGLSVGSGTAPGLFFAFVLDHLGFIF